MLPLGYLAWQNGDNVRERAIILEERSPPSTQDAPDVLPLRPVVQPGGRAQSGTGCPEESGRIEARLPGGAAAARVRVAGETGLRRALTALQDVKKVNAEQAEWFFGALAFAQMRTGDREEARRNAELAKKWAKTPSEAQTASDILHYLDSSGQDPPESERPRMVHQAAPASTFTESVHDHG